MCSWSILIAHLDSRQPPSPIIFPSPLGLYLRCPHPLLDLQSCLPFPPAQGSILYSTLVNMKPSSRLQPDPGYRTQHLNAQSTRPTRTQRSLETRINLCAESDNETWQSGKWKHQDRQRKRDRDSETCESKREKQKTKKQKNVLCRSVTSAPRRARQAYWEFKARLRYVFKPNLSR